MSVKRCLKFPWSPLSNFWVKDASIDLAPVGNSPILLEFILKISVFFCFFVSKQEKSDKPKVELFSFLLVFWGIFGFFISFFDVIIFLLLLVLLLFLIFFVFISLSKSWKIFWSLSSVNILLFFKMLLLFTSILLYVLLFK